MSKFKVGDKVVFNNGNNTFNGIIGEIIGFDNNDKPVVRYRGEDNQHNKEMRNMNGFFDDVESPKRIRKFTKLDKALK